MRTRPRAGAPNQNTDQDRAFRNGHVQTIVCELLRHKDPRLVKLAHQAVITPRPTSRDELHDQLSTMRGYRGQDVTDAQLDSAVAICAEGSRIYNHADCERLKGGLLERYVYEMVSLRAPTAVRHEHSVALTHAKHTGRDWTNPKEVVVDSDPFEVYECKWSGHLDQDDIDELGDVYATAQAEGTDARPCIAVMTSMKRVQAQLERNGVVLDEWLYIADDNDLQLLEVRPPSLRIR